MTQRDSSRLSTRPLPALLAACSRLIRWRSTKMFLSRTVRLSIDSENAPAMALNDSTAGRINFSALMRSTFFAQPGKASPFRLRARRTRLERTIRLCGPSRREVSDGGGRKSSIFIVSISSRRQIAELLFGGLDFIPHNRGLLEIFIGDGFVEFSLERFQLIGEVATLLQVLRHLARMFDALMHRLQQ